MAFSCVRVLFELGHKASLRSKCTVEGYTHDWEVFVRGADNSDISNFVDRVVFHLHDTFPKPKRVVKEPPYLVKESGYAGFVVPIDIYFKNQNEPKKVRFNYDLILQSQTTGQRGPISEVIREKYVFTNPTEDLRRRLIRGGGVGVTGASLEKALNEEMSSAKPSQLLSKPKLGGDTGKKQKVKDYKLDEPKANDQFADLFGTPIRKASPDLKKVPSVSSKNVDKVSSEKQSSSSKSSKHVPQKESSSKDERSKDRSRDKSTKRPSSPKRPPSPKSPKRSVTPSKKLSPKRPITPTLVKEKDDKEKRKKDKKKDDRNKKDRKSSEKRGSEVFEKTEKSKELKDKEKKLPKEVPVSSSKEPDKVKPKHMDLEKDKEKQKHKHKKKDKNKHEEESGGKKKEKMKTSKYDISKMMDVNDNDRNGFGEKESSRSSSHSSINKKIERNDSPSPVRPKTSPAKQAVTPDKPSSSKEKSLKPPLKMLLEELSDPESSNSNNSSSSEEEDVVDRHPHKKLSKISETFSTKANQSIENVVNSYSHSPTNVKASPAKIKSPDESSTNQNGKQKEKNNSRTKKSTMIEIGEKVSSKEIEKTTVKRKRSSGKEVKGRSEPPEKIMKIVETAKVSEDLPQRAEETSPLVPGAPRPIDIMKPHIVDGKFTADYVDQLKHLQHKIMTLDDNEELQRVVQVIAETGQYEITPKTFDFDLCTLDLLTVKRLQEFFMAS